MGSSDILPIDDTQLVSTLLPSLIQVVDRVQARDNTSCLMMEILSHLG
jgi:hypothetical protein